MIRFKLDKAKSKFFDSPKVIRSVDSATRKVLSKFGAFVRTAAKSSIRKRKRSSDAGSPPSSHAGFLKKFIYFGYEPDSRSVIVGPTRLSRPGNAPESLEHGGDTEIIVRRRVRGRIVRSNKRIRIKQRPFMQSALQKELPKLPAMWRDSVK